MIIFPAIDLKDGNCVRLYKGKMDQATVFNNSPADQAKEFTDTGCKWLHVVDLNGAFAGTPVNGDAVDGIIKAFPRKIQLGGGIRNIETIESWLSKGIERVILGTIALKSPEFVIKACKLFPKQIAVGIDARDGFVAVEGWAETSEMKVVDLALKFEDAGVSAIIYTDIDRDGAMQGANIEATQKLAEQITTDIIVSGGVSSMDDLEKIQQASRQNPNIIGAISGRAIYDGKIDLKTANTMFSK
ncbi:MAG: 1-(5-phosphoribosyl)-5-[(5-phosphoribosylamino)methylideneamino]imidazole-4-carboxamide isomerase [Alphaproteobacteria bacterium]|nr:1-(5-phosphoribosyl)-5-[(5-phosphoribosylamino)methylideneamino]imidazole-4-carboxamide isomerase [Alphaproteobacteria bacterium]